jgi:hypothetical protein
VIGACQTTKILVPRRNHKNECKLVLNYKSKRDTIFIGEYHIAISTSVQSKKEERLEINKNNIKIANIQT